MSFISYEFIILFVIVLGLYRVLDHKYQNVLLLVSSYVFYGWWDYRFLSLIFLSSLIDFVCALNCDPHNEQLSPRRRKVSVYVTICSNLAILGFFKYFNFFIDTANIMLNQFGYSGSWAPLNIILPVGISFYTFQSMSYTLDVYKGKLRASTRFLDFLLYVSFFPQLVAGPIERAVNLLPQVLNPRTMSAEKMGSGFRLALWGFFKKMVIADNLSVLVNSTFTDARPTGAAIIIGVYAFAVQIYCDFSGYTDIARGVARIFGFSIMENFRLPYFAINPTEFWKKWHISLTSWFRDYLYMPLAFRSKITETAQIRNVMITFGLSGLWHGAAWHYVIWGVFHGLLLVINSFLRPKKKVKRNKKKEPRTLIFWLKVIGYFQVTCYGWLIFRVKDMGQLWHFTRTIFSQTILADFWCISALQVLVFGIPLLVFQVYQLVKDDMEPWEKWPWYIRVPFYLCLLYGIILLGEPVQEAFIYFQF
ncbi:MBOAT family protein [bacterium]|nr:MBOAT family protein [bacterium]